MKQVTKLSCHGFNPFGIDPRKQTNNQVGYEIVGRIGVVYCQKIETRLLFVA